MNEDNTYNRLSDRRNLYFLSQTHTKGYDTYDSMVVAAWTEEEAKTFHPDGCAIFGKLETYMYEDWEGSWAAPKYVTAELIGVAEAGISGVIIASFNAG